jgi:hypothetical protein
VLRLAGAEKSPERIGGYKGSQREERNGDNPQGELFAPLRVLGGKLPRQGHGRRDLNDGIQAKADERRRVGRAPGPQCHSGLDEVIANGSHREQADPAAENGTAGRGR